MVKLHLESASELVGRRGLPANSAGDEHGVRPYPAYD